MKRLILLLMLLLWAQAAKASPIQLIAPPAENIPVYRAVVIIDGKAYKADPTNAAHAGKVLGVTLSQGTLGAGPVPIQTTGELTMTGLTANSKYYVGAGGVLSTSATFGGAVWSQYVGYARSTTLLEMNTIQVTSAAATPGGAAGQIEYNNAGAFGGFTMSGDATVNTGTGVLTLKNTGTGAGSCTNCSVTFDAQGRETTYSSGGSPQLFGGDGSDGSSGLSGTDTVPKQYNKTTATVANATTFTPFTGTVINASTSVTIGGGASGTLTAGTIGNGAPQNAASNATGAGGKGVMYAIARGAAANWSTSPNINLFTLGGGGGQNGAVSGASGGGGGGGIAAGGAGGTGGIGTGPGAAGNSWATFASVASKGYEPGGGGAGGSSTNATAQGGAGGSGGGHLTICSNGNLLVDTGATLNVNGVAGSVGVTGGAGVGSGGGGGGGGGALGIYARGNVTATGTIAADGGAGGNYSGTAGGSGGGGGGGGQLIIICSGSISGTPTANGGTKGTSGTGTASDGTAATVYSSTGTTPNFPLIVMMEENFPTIHALIYQRAPGRMYCAKAPTTCSIVAALETGRTGQPALAFAQVYNRLMAQTDDLSILPVAKDRASYIDAFLTETIRDEGLYCLGDYVDMGGRT